MLKYLQNFIRYLFHVFYHFGVVLVAGSAVAMSLSGCGTFKPEPVVITKHIVVAPADNLLVDCDIDAPPPKATYLYTTPGINPNLSLQKDSAFYLTLYANTIKVLEGRERQLTQHALNQFKNLDTCNKRWAALRAWKVTASSQLSTPQKE